MQITKVSLERYQSRAKEGYDAEIQIVTVDTDQSITGVGFASAAIATGSLQATLIGELLGPGLVGRNPMHTTDLWRLMHQEILPRRAGDGIGRTAISAIDFALWDIKAKSAGVPLYSLFGGHRPLVPTYANCAHHLPPDKLAERAAQYVAKGHRALKIRGSRSFVSLSVALERVRQVREAIGPDVKLMVDVNGTWDVDTAISQLKAFEPYNVYWLEEPVPPQDLAGYARIRARSGDTYIAGGEQHVGLVEFKALIEQGCVDVLQPNAAVTGGITDWLGIHAFATAHSIPVSPWNLQPIHLHMAAGLPNVQWIEYFMPDNALLKFQTELFTGPVLEETVNEDGVFLRAPQAPGIGLSLDQDVADRTRTRQA